VDLYTCQRTIKFGILFVFILSIIIGCARLRPSKIPIEPISSPEEVLQRVRVRESAINNLKGLAKLKVADVKKNYPTVKEVIIAQRPFSLRMETLGFLGRPMFIFTAKDNLLSILSMSKNKYYRGNITPQSRSVFSPDLKLKDLFSILLGGIPYIDYVDAEIRFIEKDKIYFVTITKKGGTAKQFLWVDPLRFTTIKSEIYNISEDLIFKVNFDKYKKIDGMLFPLSTRIVLPLTSTKIRIEYQELKLNTTINPSTFDLDTPPNAKIIDLDE
jgi:outer membrane lipoprotein-sorting protein